MQVPYTNRNKHTVHVGGKMVRPGETRDVDSALVQQPRPAKAPEAPDPDAHLREILGGKAAEVEAVLGDVTARDLERLEALEGDAKKPRKSVLEAIEAEKLERAKASGDDGAGENGGQQNAADPELEQFRTEIREMPADELDDLRTLYADDQEAEKYADYVAAIDAEKQRRAVEGDGDAAGDD